MLDEANDRRRARHDARQPRLAFQQRQFPQVLAAGEQQVEDEEDQIVGLAVGDRRLQRREVRRAGVVEGDHLPVDDPVGQTRAGPDDGRELRRPVQPLAGQQRRMAVLGAQLHAIAVELDLMRPALALRRLLRRLGELRLDELRQCGWLGHLCLLRGGRHRRRGRGGRMVAGTALPHGVGRRSARGHERLGGTALAGGDLGHASARGDRAILRRQRAAVLLHRAGVAVLDQQPVVALAVVLQPHQHPAAVQPAALHDELQLALGQRLVHVLEALLGRPIAAVPQLHHAAAVLAPGDCAFEVAVGQRVILDLDRQPLVVRVQRRAPGHRPRLEHPLPLEPQIEVQPRGGVLLDHEPQPVRLDHLGVLAGRLGGLREIPHLPILGEFGRRHGDAPANQLLQRLGRACDPASAAATGKSFFVAAR